MARLSLTEISAQDINDLAKGHQIAHGNFVKKVFMTLQFIQHGPQEKFDMRSFIANLNNRLQTIDTNDGRNPNDPSPRSNFEGLNKDIEMINDTIPVDESGNMELSHAMARIIGHLSNAVLHYDAENTMNDQEYNSNPGLVSYSKHVDGTFEDSLALAFVELFDMAEEVGIDLEKLLVGRVKLTANHNQCKGGTSGW